MGMMEETVLRKMVSERRMVTPEEDQWWRWWPLILNYRDWVFPLSLVAEWSPGRPLMQSEDKEQLDLRNSRESSSASLLRTWCRGKALGSTHTQPHFLWLEHLNNNQILNFCKGRWEWEHSHFSWAKILYLWENIKLIIYFIILHRNTYPALPTLRWV